MSPSCKIEQEKDFMVVGLLCLITVSISNFFHFHAVFGKIFVKRETIPVVCISPAFVVLGEGVRVYLPPPWIPYAHLQIPYPLNTLPPQKGMGQRTGDQRYPTSPMNRMTARPLLKHYLPATTVPGGKICWCTLSGVAPPSFVKSWICHWYLLLDWEDGRSNYCCVNVNS